MLVFCTSTEIKGEKNLPHHFKQIVVHLYPKYRVILDLILLFKFYKMTLSPYFSSPPTLSLWWVELGPQVRPFFLLAVRSSFLHTALRPHVLLPSLGVTEKTRTVETFRKHVHTHNACLLLQIFVLTGKLKQCS